jgi:hypothetical protein
LVILFLSWTGKEGSGEIFRRTCLLNYGLLSKSIPITKLHLETIGRKYYSLVRTTIENELQFEPEVETRNRKPLKRPVTFESEWELRFGPDNRFRVFYDLSLARQQIREGSGIRHEDFWREGEDNNG